jgi:LmbE family N-acetylglucosaminyl deacetylase
MSNVLVLSVHPDDETLGCGGTLLRHKADGDDIYWLIATSIKEEHGFSREKTLERQKEINAVKDMYDFSGVFNLGIPTMRTDKFPLHELITKISEVFNEAKPEIVYLPFMNDIHSDHRILFQAAYSCTKTFRYPFIKKILMMETISETEFVPPTKDTVFLPNYFVDISGFLDKKLEAMKVYKDEYGRHPFPRSSKTIRALAAFRGSMAGCDFAEAFMILKEIA